MGFPFAFQHTHRCGNIIILEFSSKWVKDMLPYREGRGLPAGGGGRVLITHSVGWLCKYSKSSIQIGDDF
jgi:hypothetical protein